MNKYLAWDLDGVLVDTDAMHKHALNAALSVTPGCHTISDDEHLSVYKGLPTKVKLQMMIKEGRVPASMLLSVSNLKQDFTASSICETIKPDREKRALLMALELRGFAQAICSNCIRESVKSLVLFAGLADLFKFLLSAEDVEIAKPAPDMYEKAAYLFNIPPSSLVVIEDGEAGKQAARDAGCHLIEVSGPREVTRDGLLPRILEVAEDAIAK